MNKIITSEETKELFRFCQKHYVYQYDVQIELVDHLASSVEERWQQNPEIPFQKALMDSFGKFGIYGFSKIKEQKEKELRRKYNRLLWGYLLDFYHWPKMVMTVAFTMIFFSLLRFTENGFWVMSTYFVAMALLVLVYFYKIFPKYFKVKTKPGKSFLLLQRLKDVQMAGFFIIQFPIQAYNFRRWFDSVLFDNTWVLLAISFFTISLTILLYGNFFYLPQKIREHFMEQFAEFAD
jgi:hypothetical protein